jgi:hypothetical protein
MHATSINPHTLPRMPASTCVNSPASGGGYCSLTAGIPNDYLNRGQGPKPTIKADCLVAYIHIELCSLCLYFLKNQSLVGFKATTNTATMLGKIALEECWTIPEELENNNPSRFVPAGTGDRLTSELMDIHSHRLRQMDENGVDFMVLSFSSAGCQGLADKATAEAQATLANDRLEAEVMKNPVRFAAFAALSMHDPKQAAEELTRCMTQKKGFVGALLNDFQSAGPDENTMLFYDTKEYDVFWKAANDLKAPVYLHPRLPTPLIHEQMWKDRPWLNFSALGYADRLKCMLWVLLPVVSWIAFQT